MLAVNPKDIYVLYARSLGWLTVLAVVAVCASVVVSIVFIDFVHGNPHRTQTNALETMMLFALVVGVIAAVDSVIVFALPQCFQAVVSDGLVRWFGGRAQAAVLVALPMTAVITWYAFDYFIPTNVPHATTAGSGDWQPYQHGLTTARYLTALGCQTPATLFNIAYVAATGTRFSRKSVVRLGFVAAILAGGFAGYGDAKGQYQFL